MLHFILLVVIIKANFISIEFKVFKINYLKFTKKIFNLIVKS